MRVKKLRRIGIYEIDKMESYLSDMAKEGLFLIGMSSSCNVFKKKAPAEMEYRIEFGEKVLKKEMREMYEMSGWRYTCSFRGIHIFQAAASDALVEIHTDPIEQSYTLRKSCKTLVRLISLEISLLLFVIVISFFATKIGGTPVLNLLENNFIYMINIMLMLYIIFEIVRQMKTLIHIKSRLQMGFFINHHEPWKKRSISQCMIYGILSVTMLICIVSIVSNIRSIVGTITGKSHYAIELATELPVVRLNDVENLKSPMIQTYHPINGKHLQSSVRDSYYVFVQEKEINEVFIQEDMTWEGEVYTPSLRTKYYKVNIPFLVQGALSDVLHKAENYFVSLPYDKTTVEKLDCDGLDEVYYIPADLERDNYFGLVVRKNSTILWMIYYGQKTREEVIAASQTLFD